MGTVGTSTDEIAGERRYLSNVAYRLLGSVTEAEDAVQDAYVRWYGLPRSRQEEIRSPGAWLTTVTSRICLDLLGSARARRERYVGAWSPEPLPERTDGTTRAAPTPPDSQIPPTRSSWLTPWRPGRRRARAVRDPGKVLLDIALAAAIRTARTEVRAHVWTLAGEATPDAGGQVPMELGGVLVIAHSEKQGPAAWRRPADTTRSWGSSARTTTGAGPGNRSWACCGREHRLLHRCRP